jgi:peptidoglycan/LPS O-acetylase OafA/YrhL
MSMYVVNAVRHPPNRALDVLRGAAALLVILGHARVFLLRGLELDLGSIPPEERVLLAPTSFAQESVAVFFVLSGFLVGGQVLREVGGDRFGWRRYLAKRLSRLWTVLIPGLLLTLVLDSVSARFPRFDLLGTLPLDAESFLCNAVFLQQPRCGWYGSNESLWSLAFEFWFYILFAAVTVAVAAVARSTWSRAAVGAGVAVLTLLVFGPDLLRLLPSWLLGVAVAVVVDRRRGTGSAVRAAGRAAVARHVLLALALLIAGMLAANVLLSEETATAQLARFALVGLAAVPLVAVLALRPTANDSRLLRSLAASGNWSYSSYVFHAPILKLIIVVALAFDLVADGPLLVPVVYAVAVIGYLLTIPLWAVTERHTARVRNALLTVLRVRERRRGDATEDPSS